MARCFANGIAILLPHISMKTTTTEQYSFPFLFLLFVVVVRSNTEKGQLRPWVVQDWNIVLDVHFQWGAWLYRMENCFDLLCIYRLRSVAVVKPSAISGWSLNQYKPSAESILES